MCCHELRRKNNRMFQKAPTYSKNPKKGFYRLHEKQTVPGQPTAEQHHAIPGWVEEDGGGQGRKLISRKEEQFYRIAHFWAEDMPNLTGSLPGS